MPTMSQFIRQQTSEDTGVVEAAVQVVKAKEANNYDDLLAALDDLEGAVMEWRKAGNG